MGRLHAREACDSCGPLESTLAAPNTCGTVPMACAVQGGRGVVLQIASCFAASGVPARCPGTGLCFTGRREEPRDVVVHQFVRVECGP